MINLTINQGNRVRAVERLKEKGVLLPTFGELCQPEQISETVKDRLKEVGLWEINPLNLFRISWKNEPFGIGGRYGRVNYIEVPECLTGVKARIFGLVGKWFPTGAHKVGATYGCMVPRLVTGQFDPSRHKAVWPSTGNFCRGGAFNSALIGCDSVAILPEEMSRERFEWLMTMAGEVIASPGCESNVKEIYDKCAELRATRSDVFIFNQFEDFGNYLWHYAVTGPAVAEVFQQERALNDRLAGLVSATGSGGTLACGDYIKQHFADTKIVAVEALQCPTLSLNGYGGHRIEGIGDKHVPWIHNVRNTDVVIALDDSAPLQLIRLFNESTGQDYLAEIGLNDDQIASLPLLGISGVANLLGAIKTARYFELTEKDIIFTVFTDSMDLYQSRITESRKAYGPYTREDAVRDYHRHLMGQSIDNMLELSYYDRKRIHNLKYFTWVEQQGKSVADLDAQWYDWPDYWIDIQKQVAGIDAAIRDFNHQTGLGGDI
ncbi:MAG: pyridoxal-phosphate dependent enzyme [Deltaproteobacteria bacterium]|nr:MAG: pyridoxal-phosphate dependent enzyme [Deltaproteobacteria bacterium]